MTENEFLELCKGISQQALNINNTYEEKLQKTLTAFDAYFKHNGIIKPSDGTDYFHWLAIAFPDESFSFIISAADNPNYFKMFHDYKERLFNNSNWNDEKEREYLQKHFFAEPQPTERLGEPQQGFDFSVLEWATIFYYAEQCNLLPEYSSKENAMQDFMERFNISKSFSNFKNKYYTNVVKAINKTNTYPIGKLEKILPFLEDNFKATIPKVENDISFLQENKDADY